MKKSKNVLKAFLGLAFLVGSNLFAQTTEKFSTEMSGKTNIVEYALGSREHTTLVSALKAANLVETLVGAGPFTVFAPTNDAFNKVPKETLASLLQPENKEKLQSILTCHVISGKFDSKAIAEAIKEGSGTATFVTVQGAKISGSFVGKKLVLTDNTGAKINVTTADLNQTNGIIHVVDSVIMP